MTSTSVKDVSTVLQAARASAGANVQAAKDGGFQAVLGKQTSRSKSGEAANASAAKAETKQGDNVRSGENVKPDKVSDKKEAEEAKKAENTKESETEPKEVDEKALEKAMEILQTAAAELIARIAETFGISEGEVTQIMNGMELQPLDLLQQETLSELLLKAAGAEDSMALLTDEGLYGNFRTIMNAQSDILAESAETLQADMERLQQLITEAENGMTGDALAEDLRGTEGREPVIEVTRFGETDTEQGQDAWTDSRLAVEDGAQNEKANALGTGEKTRGESRHSGNDTAGQHQSSNILLQQLREDSFRTGLGQVSESGFAGDMETQDIMRQIMDYMKVQIKPDVSNLEMQLHPASLGTLQVQVASKGGVVTAQFITQNEAVKAALESQMVQLQESFAEQGVKVEAIEVTVQTHQFEQNLEQGRERNQEAPERKNRIRRIRLDSSVMTEGMEELNEEEQLAAQMMSASGGTVDFTA